MSQQSPQSSFRVSQALYKTILTNLKVILGVFLFGLVIWLFLYLMPLTASHSTYNADSHERALKLTINYLVDSHRGAEIVINPIANKTTASCDFLTEKSQKAYEGYINSINTNLDNLFKKQNLANQYILDTKGLWQAACQQNISPDDMLFALKTLANPDKLIQLNWAERHSKTSHDTGVATLPDNWLTQTNPWYGLPGCVYVKSSVTKNNPTGYSYVDNHDSFEMAQLCNHSKLLPANIQTNNSTSTEQKLLIKSTKENNIFLPANLGMMYSELSNIHSNHFDKQLLDAYESYQRKNDQRSFWQRLTMPPINTIPLDGSNVKIGYNMQLTIDPKVQNTVQLVANCFTKNPVNSTQAQQCKAIMSDQLQTTANQMYENALVRSIGIAVVDVKTQGILALASSDSPCYRKDNGDINNATDCPVLWKKDWSKQKLMNHALYQTVYPGSIIKTVQALGLVRANPAFKNPKSAESAYLKQVMASSSTEKVANFLFCQQTTSNMILHRNAQGVCSGIPAFKQASLDMGWSVNCDEASTLCGSKDLLFGLPYNSEPMLQSRYFSGVLLTDSKQHIADLNFSANQVANCVSANNGRMSGGCSKGGDILNAVMNEVYGAGNAKTSVLGAADMFSSLLIADNGKKQRRGAHLIQDLWGVNQVKLRPRAWRGDAPYGQYDNLAMMPLNISQSDARATLNLLSGTLLSGTGLGGGNGTAYTACTQAIGDCSWTKNIVIGKTGTPGFNFPVSKNGQIIYTPNVTVNMVKSTCYNAKKPSFVCQNRPYKWFVMGIKDKHGKWDKAVAILVERNWQKTTGLVDDARDGINRSAQAGAILAKQFYNQK